MARIFNCFQFLMFPLGLGIQCGYPSLVATLIAVACSQFDKLKSDLMDIRQQHITPRHGEEDEQVPTRANCDFQVKLNACIQHHQEILE
jgi:hypothetical protein